tara:strand:+ start:175 stop:768 length:594 start_codon:yes stop_codon:yes gene_type:complete
MTTPTIEIDNSIYVANVMFPDELCDKAINVIENKANKFDKSHFHKNEGGLKRKDKVCFLDDFELDMLCDSGETNLIADINAYLTDALVEYCTIFASLGETSIRSTRQKLQKTKKGGGYHVWHHEQSSIDSIHRVLVWTIYLNDVEEGGETEFLYQSKRIKARKGKICMFPAGFTHVHRGNPPLSGDKYILTGWWHLY